MSLVHSRHCQARIRLSVASAAAVGAAFTFGTASAQQAVDAPEVEVVGHYEMGIGSSDAASQGAVTSKLIEDRPILRPGEILEFVPGLIVTQHSGDGKANQYFLRGYNLDHGTDFATTVQGMPVNMPTHAHGQGYSDINFMIPELVERIDFFKGPYFADKGDFASAGAADIHYYDKLPQNIGSVTVGSDRYGRVVMAASPKLGEGTLLGAIEALHSNGPWENSSNYRKYNGVLSYNQGDAGNGVTLTGMAYNGQWNSTDQIPQRAVYGGLINEFGAIDNSDGGESSRYSVSFQGRKKLDSLGSGQLQFNAYAIRYSLDLFSNFTYLLDDPDLGDQFQQSDRRTVYGGDVSYAIPHKLAGFESVTRVGVQTRYDDIDRVALYHTQRQNYVSTTREDSVGEWGSGFYVDNSTQWTKWFRSVVGARWDYYRFDVDSNLAQNSGQKNDNLVSPKLSFIFGPWSKTEYFFNAGYGFHSNDARGTTTTVDPTDPTVAADPVTPLVRTKGAEVGVRTEIIPNVQSSLALWGLKQDSELLFVGDAGITEPSRPSRRYGIEWVTYWRPLKWLTFDAELSLTNARFNDDDPNGAYIPGAVSQVGQLGVTVDNLGKWYGSFQLRYLGTRPLIEDNSVRSNPLTVANARVGYRITKNTRLHLDVLNLFDSDGHDIDYFYASRLPGEPVGGVDDIHFHPIEPRQFRLTLIATF